MGYPGHMLNGRNSVTAIMEKSAFDRERFMAEVRRATSARPLVA
jgi:hypothetical protein